MEAFYRNLVSGRSVGFGPSLLRWLLAGCSVPYHLAVAIRNQLYDSGMLPAVRVPVPVVSIGNLTLGGTGKTPFVELVCGWFLARGKRVAILSRGYRALGGRNDEAMLLEANLPEVPHLQGSDRVSLAQRAVDDFRPDVIVLDDGFQHRRLARDLDIVLIDCTEPFGYGCLFPRGLLREPITSLSRADLVVLSRSDHCCDAERRRIREVIHTAAGDKPIVLAAHRPAGLRSHGGPLVPVGALAGKSVTAFCGIGNPEAFRQTLRGLGCDLLGMRAFPDHHSYTSSDLLALELWCRQLRPALVVTTQKDLVKMDATHLGNRPLVALQIEVEITESSGALDSALAQLLQVRPGLSRAA